MPIQRAKPRFTEVKNFSITGTDLPAGSVLQVKQGTLTTNFVSSGSSTAFADIGLQVAITPTSASNKILVTGLISFSPGSNDHGDIKVLRNGSDFMQSTESASTRTKSHLHTYGSASDSTRYQIQPGNINFLDSPNTTSEVIYKVQTGTPHDAAYIMQINRDFYNTNAAYSSEVISTITAMEIKG